MISPVSPSRPSPGRPVRVGASPRREPMSRWSPRTPFPEESVRVPPEALLPAGTVSPHTPVPDPPVWVSPHREPMNQQESPAIGGGFVLSTGGHGKSQLRPFPSSTSRNSFSRRTPAGGQQDPTIAARCAAEVPGSADESEVVGPPLDRAGGAEVPGSADESEVVGPPLDRAGGADLEPGPARGDRGSFAHVPVMAKEIVGIFDEVPPGLIIDATLGGGGHSEALLESRSDITVVGLDRDPAALAAATARLARFGERFRARHLRFDHLEQALEGSRASGVLFDLGVSSHQLDRPERGFSYRAGGPLDMRMDPSSPTTAADVVNTYTEAELARVLREHADERFASRIARAIVAARPLSDTAELAETVVSAIPAAARRSGPHPATRSFQAIRIEVNSELEVLTPALEAAIESLAPKGRIAVLAYHSGEDRIVKSVLREASRTSPPGRPDLPPPPGFAPRLRLLRSIARRPGESETAVNPRSTSARLRAAERI